MVQTKEKPQNNNNKNHSLSGAPTLDGLDPVRYVEGMQGATHTLVSVPHMKASQVSGTEQGMLLPWALACALGFSCLYSGP